MNPLSATVWRDAATLCFLEMLIINELYNVGNAAKYEYQT